MNIMHSLFILTVNFDLTPFAQEYSFILFLAILSLAFTIILRTTKVFLAQFFLLLSFFFLSGSTGGMLTFLIITIQLLLTIVLLYRLHKAIYRNYLLVEEKIHRRPRHITKYGAGVQKSFFGK